MAEYTEILHQLSLLDQDLAILAGLLPHSPAPEEARKLGRVLVDRLLFEDPPLLVALAGPTGAGKSHIFNALVGFPLSPSGYRRPSTISPVLALRKACRILGRESFLPDYPRKAVYGPVEFEPGRPALYVGAATDPPWAWPEDLALLDTPDFDSVLPENQKRTRDMARRADALIFICHQAKYADQSVWDFLEEERAGGRPLMIILNRYSEPPVLEDFRARLDARGLDAPLLTWPDERGASRAEALAEIGGRLQSWAETAPRLIREAGERTFRSFRNLTLNQVAEPLLACTARTRGRLEAVGRITRDWVREPEKHLSLSLPEEGREELLKKLSDLVLRSDIWAAPRRLMARPLVRLGWIFKRALGSEEPPRSPAPDLSEISREALLTAVREEGRHLAEASGLDDSSLRLSPEEIRERQAALERSLAGWFKTESEKMLSGLPLGRKAAFYLVQFTHLGAILGLSLQAGGLPGTEVLIGGALGPVLSKLAGAAISRETLAAFESRAQNHHRALLAEIFQEQGRRFELFLAASLKELSPAGRLDDRLAGIQRGLAL